MRYMTTRSARIGGVEVRLSRVTFVGELGWEVYVPTEFGRSVYALLAQAVAVAGGLRCGYRAIDSLRAEKGYLYLGADLRTDRTPLESGLGRFVRADRSFVGGAALPVGDRTPERLGCFTLDGSRWVPQGGETVLLPGSRTSTVTSAGLGHTLDAVIGFAYLPADIGPGTAVTVLAGGSELAATVRAQPLYDPNGTRILA
jgi:4-methylaminobutanoate oxidase (formaldehyde-forming)